MEIYCLPEFKRIYEKLIKNNSYSSLTQEIIDCLEGKKISDCLHGRNLNKSQTAPYLKKDLGGRSGFRLYCVALINQEKMYLGYVHPKTGSDGSSNTLDDKRGDIIKDIYNAINNNELFKITFENGTLLFKEA